MRKILFNRRGVALITAILVMLVVLMLSSVLLSTAVISATVSKNKNTEITQAVYASCIGEAFINQGLALDTAAFSSDYVLDINNAEQSLTVKRAKDDALLLKVIIEETADGNRLVSWKRVYNVN